MTNVFEALRHDHDIQRDLVGRLIDTSGASKERVAVLDELKAELTAHAGSEERHFYVALIEHDLTQDKARHSVAEHQELDELVEQLNGYDMTAPNWLETAEVLRERLLHHLDEEEHEVFQLGGKVLDETQKIALASAYEQAMSQARSGRA